MDEIKTTDTMNEQAEKHIVTFKKPYTFEKKEYTSIDLSGIENLKVKDLIETQRQMFSDSDTTTMAMSAMESATAFIIAVATYMTGMPIEFFQCMKAGAMEQVQKEVNKALLPDAKAKGNVLTFAEPHLYKGESYDKVDLSAANELTAMDVANAENRLASDGFPPVAKERNYRYICIICAKATGLSEEFFAELPARDGIALRNIVNSDSFFE